MNCSQQQDSGERSDVSTRCGAKRVAGKPKFRNFLSLIFNSLPRLTSLAGALGLTLNTQQILRFRIFKYLPTWPASPADEVVDLDLADRSYVKLVLLVRRTWETHLDVMRPGRAA